MVQQFAIEVISPRPTRKTRKMVDHIRPIALATLANLSKTEDGGNNRTFSIQGIATRAAQLFTLD